MKAKTTTEELVALRKMYTFKRISKITGLSENVVKNRIYKIEKTKGQPIKSKSGNLNSAQKEKASSLHYFGYAACEIAKEINSNLEDVKAYVAELPKHPDYKKKTD